MNNKKGFFITTILFLVILFVMTIGGFYLKTFKGVKEKKEVVTYVNTINFYNENKELLNKYSCQNKYCDFVKPIIDDNNYLLDYYKDGNLEYNKIINNRYAFIYDTVTENYESIILFDLIDQKTVNTYKAIKNYNTLIENDIYFVEDLNNNWGVVSFLDGEFKELVAPQYTYIGLINNIDIENNKLISDRFLVLKNNKWAIIDQNDVLLSAYLEESIVDYNGLYIKTLVNNLYKIYDYSGNAILNNDNYINISITGKYIELVSENKKITIYDPENSRIIGTTTLKTIDFSEDAVFPPYETSLVDNEITLKVYTDQQYGTYRTYKYAA